MKRKQFSLRINTIILDQIDQIALDNNMSRSDVLRIILAKWYKNNKR